MSPASMIFAFIDPVENGNFEYFFMEEGPQQGIRAEVPQRWGVALQWSWRSPRQVLTWPVG